MKKIGIIGNFAACYKQDGVWGGQTIKTKILLEYLQSQLTDISLVDVNYIKKRPIGVLVEIARLYKRNEKIIFIVGTNGFQILLPIVVLFQYIYKRKTFEVVIGGIRQQILEKNLFLKVLDKRITCVYLETRKMVDIYSKMGFDNIAYLPNFKSIKPLEKVYPYDYTQYPLKICTFTRVARDKGIDTIISAITEVNSEADKVLYNLDIYGEIDENYKNEFENLVDTFPEYIKYRGIVKAYDATDTLKDYFAMSFLTTHQGEGFPGTLIDAFSAGIPVIATDFNYNAEIVENGVTGIIVRNDILQETKEALKYCAEHPEKMDTMREKALEKSQSYLSENVLKEFLEELKI